MLKFQRCEEAFEKSLHRSAAAAGGGGGVSLGRARLKRVYKKKKINK